MASNYKIRIKELRLYATEDWIHDLIQAKQLKATKVKKWRIKPEDLEDFVRKRRINEMRFLDGYR